MLEAPKATATPTARSSLPTAATPAAAERLMHMVKAVFEGAQVRVTECGGLCSYYAELGGLMVGFEDADA